MSAFQNSVLAAYSVLRLVQGNISVQLPRGFLVKDESVRLCSRAGDRVVVQGLGAYRESWLSTVAVFVGRPETAIVMLIDGGFFSPVCEVCRRAASGE